MIEINPLLLVLFTLSVEMTSSIYRWLFMQKTGWIVHLARRGPPLNARIDYADGFSLTSQSAERFSNCQNLQCMTQIFFAPNISQGPHPYSLFPQETSIGRSTPFEKHSEGFRGENFVGYPKCSVDVSCDNMSMWPLG